MRPDSRFIKQPKKFWAHVRTISQHIGYTARGAGRIRIPTLAEIRAALRELGLKTSHILDDAGNPTQFGSLLVRYFDYRASVLNTFVEPKFMNKDSARVLFREQKKRLRPSCPIPMNKQKGGQKGPGVFHRDCQHAHRV
jgi:hypothetical protein